ncbi:hypothetical protein [Corallococcus carmarthensis]|uniref:Uncharacterized protein n=1 Tax=Corallococcus carmarthensis TaxID=2316728 RepID=A0A3A8K8K1_9BACT|nr:hypothetical protein [Corallococcus carmarthensis]NOK15733.1 hypothetical protein [Corallococcus carmarthensis]RKG98761.1 hypothetical protein D7X32_28595 [Corallococcus carmarthensis]
MHDVDRTYRELEGESFEFEFNAENEWGEVFNENELNELASELLEVSNEQELEQFLGNIIKKVGGAVGQFVKSPLGKQLGGMLKGLAKQALPMVGSALGNLVVPGVGGAVGGKLASMAGQAFGLELEGLSQEDREFEVAKQVVRLSADAAKAALSAPGNSAPQQVASAAINQAIQKFAPGLSNQLAMRAAGTGGRSGRWVRKGNKIILFGV